MKRYSEITFKYLKSHKKRTILTICGVLLSLALISSIGTLFFSLHANQIKQIIEGKGDYHFRYEQTDANLAQRLKNHAKVDRLSIVQKQADIPLTDQGDSLLLHGMNQEAMETLPLKLIKGKTPNQPNEIMVEKWALEKMKPVPGMGDSLDLKVDGKKQTYTLVGILENGLDSQYKQEAQAATVLSSVPKNAELDLYVKLKPGVSIRDSIPEFEKMITEGKLITNKELLRLLGEGEDQKVNMALVTISGILIGLVTIATVAVIYNAFHISVLERIKQFGVLRSIGATPKQIRNLVFREAFLICMVGIPLGVLLGTFSLRWVLGLFPSDYLIGAEEIVINPKVVFISMAIGLISVFASAFLPARLASKVSPLDAIQNRGSLKKETVKQSRGRLYPWLRIELAMALKNLRRNKKRYRITLFSIMISVVLFMVFGSFVNMMFQVQPPGNEEEHLDFTIYQSSSELIPYEKLETIRSLAGIDKAMPRYNGLFMPAIMPSSKVTPEYTDAFPYTSIEHGNQPHTALDSLIHVYDRQRLQDAKRYLQAGTINAREMDEENGVVVVVRNRAHSLKKDNKRMDVLAADLQPGDEIFLDINGRSSEKKKFPNDAFKVKVAAVLDKSPYGEPYAEGGIWIITTEQVIEKMMKQIDPNVYQDIYGVPFSGISIYSIDMKLKPGTNREQVRTALQEITEKDSTIHLVDRFEEKQRQKESEMQFKVMVYGFIVVITLIGALNIINTVSTNVILRKREFATLKAIGMTMKQVKKMVLFEGSLYGFAGGVYGLLVGLPLSYLLYLQFNDILGFTWSIPWMNIVIAFVGSIFIGLVSTLLPLRRIQNGSIIDDIRMEE